MHIEREPFFLCKYEEIGQGPRRKRLIGAAMVREKDGCDFLF